MVKRTPLITGSVRTVLPSLQPCGSWAAYQRHRKAKEPACDKCMQASRDYMMLLRGPSRRWLTQGKRDGRPVTGLCVVCGGSYVGHPVFGDCFRKATGTA